MLLQIDERKLTEKEKQFIEQMQKNKTAKNVNWVELMIEEETEIRAEEIQNDCPEEFLEYVKRNFEKNTNNNLDAVINHAYLDDIWNDSIEDLGERLYEGNII